MKKDQTVTISKKNIYFFGGFIILIILGFFLYLNYGYLDLKSLVIPEKNVAIVNGELIKEGELNKAFESIQKSGGNLNKSEVLSQLIDRKLLIQEAEKLGYVASKKDAEEKLGEYLLTQGTSLEDLKKQLGKKEYELILENYIDQIKITKLAETLRNESKITVTDLEGREFFEENKESFNQIQENVTYEDISEQIKALLIQRKEVSMIQELIDSLREKATISYP